MQEMQVIAQNKALIGEAEPALKRHLKMLTERFQEKLAEHKTWLFRVRSVTEGMLKAVADEITAKQTKPNGYTKEAAAPSARPASPAILSLDQTV